MTRMPRTLKWGGKNTDVILAGIELALRGLKDATSTIPVASSFGPVVAAALGTVRAIQEVRSDRERAISLATRIRNLVGNLHKSLDCNQTVVDCTLQQYLTIAETQFSAIRERIEKISKKSMLKKLFQRAQLSRVLDECAAEVDDVMHTFQITGMLIIHQRVMELTAVVGMATYPHLKSDAQDDSTDPAVAGWPSYGDNVDEQTFMKLENTKRETTIFIYPARLGPKNSCI